MNKLSLVVFIAMSTFSVISKAADVQVILDGSILGQSCNVSSNDLVKNINFPDISTTNFSRVGDYTAPQKFIISLNGCTGNVTNLSYTFSGDLDDINPNLFKIKGNSNSEQSEVASGLGIEVLNASFDSIPPNEKVKLNKAIATANYNLEFNVRYKSTSLNVTAGDASSILYLDIFYD